MNAPEKTQAEAPEPEPAPDPDDSNVRRPELPSLIGFTVVMKGELTVGEDLTIEGSFDGSIIGNGDETVTVRRLARLRGELSARDLRVEDGTNLEETVLTGRIRLADD